MLKKITAIFCSVVMAVSMAGCQKEQKASNAVTAGGDGKLCEEYTELTAFYNANKSTDDGQHPLFAEAAKITNVGLEVTISKNNSDFTQAFNLMVAGGDMPDIVMTYDPVSFSQLGEEGAFVPLNEYIDEFAPNVKKILNENPEIKERITAADGNIYYLPHIPGGVASTGWFIRQDWLDKLGLPVPENTEDLYNVLTAFRNQDPNGNGLKDEVPVFEDDSMNELFTLWGARPAWYIEDGKVNYGPYTSSYKTAVENIVKWFSEGLIDREIFTRAGSPRERMLGDNIGGCTVNWFGSTANYNDSLKDIIPGFSFVPMAPPSGVVLSRRPISSLYGWGVSASSKNIELAIKYLDFWYSEKGSTMMNFGIEGTHYDVVDGKPIFKAELLADPNFQKNLKNFGIQLDIGFKQNFDYERQWINSIAESGMDMYEKNDYFVEQFPYIIGWMNSDEIDEYKKLQTQIDTYSQEMLQKWILGAEKLDETYEQYLKQLEKFGVKRLIELQQEVYDRHN